MIGLIIASVLMGLLMISVILFGVILVMSDGWSEDEDWDD